MLVVDGVVSVVDDVVLVVDDVGMGGLVVVDVGIVNCGWCGDLGYRCLSSSPY